MTDEAPNPFDVVRTGYDKVSEAYRSDDFAYEGTEYEKILSVFSSRLEPHSRILDLGCGCGVPVCKVLAADHHVLGVDLSPVQIARARRLVPRAQFLCQDMTTLKFDDASFDGIVSLFAIIHVPVGQHYALLAEIARWLKPFGVLALTVGRTSWTGTEEDWCGVAGATMFWSHAEAKTYGQWITSLGLRIHRQWVIPEDTGGHPVILATKDSVPGAEGHDRVSAG